MSHLLYLQDILCERRNSWDIELSAILAESFMKRAKEVGEDAYKLPRADADSWFEQEAKPILERHFEALYKRNPHQLISLNNIIREHQLPLDIVTRDDLMKSFVKRATALNNKDERGRIVLPRSEAHNWLENEVKPIIEAARAKEAGLQ
jgi:hypothetical protein